MGGWMAWLSSGPMWQQLTRTKHGRFLLRQMNFDLLQNGASLGTEFNYFIVGKITNLFVHYIIFINGINNI